MTKKKTCFAVLTSACVLSLLGSTALAAYDASATVTNNISLDTVDIELTEYSLEEGKEVSYEDPTEELVPGATISKIPRITNQGADAYLRVKITVDTEFENGNEDSVVLTFDDINGMNENAWTLCDDGYYYLNSTFVSGDSVDLFESVVIPLEWDNNNIDADCSIEIVAEAIQSANFTPDLSSDSPWGDEEIEECVRSRDYRELAEGGNTGFVMSYSNDSGELIVNEEDLFSNISSLMPGDTAEDSLVISNEGDTDVELFFSSNVFDEYELEEDEELLNQIGLTISVKNSENNELTELYSGTLAAEELATAQSIGTFEAGYDGELEFELSVPETLKNEFNMTATSVQWNFGLTDFGAPTTIYTPEVTTKETPKTGYDMAKVASYGLLVLSVGCVLAMSAIEVKKKKVQRKENA